MVSEPAIVVEDRKELTYLLSQAAELEHGLDVSSTFCAAFSSAERAGPRPSARAAQPAVERLAPERSSPSPADEILHQGDRPEPARRPIGSRAVRAPTTPPPSSAPLPATVPVPAAALRRGRRSATSCPWSDRKGRWAPTLSRPPAGRHAPAGRCSPDEVVPPGPGLRHRRPPLPLHRSRPQPRLADRLGADELFVGPAFHQADERTFR